MTKKKKKDKPKPPQTLREGAEETLRTTPTDITKMTTGDVQRLVHELQVHQIELELQNQELRNAQVAESRDPNSDTEKKKAEQALRESEQRFRQMADHAPVMIWISGIDKLSTWFNKPWLEFTGRTLEQECGKGWTDGVHPDDFERCLETYGASFDSRQPFTMEYRLRRHDGQWRWLLDTGIPLYNGSGVFVGYIGSCIDITQRKEGEKALHESEERMRTILNTAADSIITIDRHGIIVAANPAAERMFGYTLAELVGQNVKLLMPTPYCDEHDGYILRYLETGKAHIIGTTRETVGRRKNGATFPIDLSVSEIKHLGLFTGIHRDISERKQTERELDQYKRRLRTMSWELMLAEERERQRLAQDLHDGLGQALFRARMKLDHASMDDEAAREIGAILDDIGKMVNTLTFELSPPVLRQLGLRPAIKWLAGDMKQRYGLSVQVDDDGQALALDERAALVVFRSLQELLINVAKHAQTNLATMSVRKRGNNLQVSVEDQGTGFDLANQSHHVEAGHFGLFSIRERLEYLGGSFKIQSAPGEGTRVTLTVPAETDSQEPKS